MPLTALQPDAGCRTLLRAATHGAHDRLDGLLAGGLATADIYRGYVAGMHRFVSDTETVLGEGPLRSLWLARDLVVLGLAPLAPEGRLQRGGCADERLGWRYVMAGSSVGARMLKKDAQRLGFDQHQGATFLARHAANGDWPLVLRQLDAIAPTDTPRMTAIVHGAQAAFAAAEACLRRALLPDPIA